MAIPSFPDDPGVLAGPAHDLPGPDANARLPLAHRCQLANPGDRAARLGPGPHYWIGDRQPNRPTSGE